MIRTVEIAPYNSNWPQMFAAEATLIKQALGDNCVAIHHIGSTSVPGLAAKPVIDIIPAVMDITKVDDEKMEKLGYLAMGENGMLFRRFFQIRTPEKSFNVHVFEQNSSEVTRHIKFRDWMRTNEEDRLAYVELKHELAQQFKHDITAYCFGKEQFVASIDKKTQHTGLRAVFALTPQEWATVKDFRQKYFFDKKNITDPYTWTFLHAEHIHVVMYFGSEIIGYTHLQIWPDKRVAVRIMVIDEIFRNQGYGKQLLMFCERWLKEKGFKSLQMEASPQALKFYNGNGYTSMPFNDPENHEASEQDTPLGKML